MEKASPVLSLVLMRSGNPESAVQVADEDDLAAAIRSFGGKGVLCQSEPSEDEPDERDICPLGDADASTGWDEAKEMLRRGNQTLYLQGDCWHLALALNRLYGLPVVAVINRRNEGEEGHSHPDKRNETVGHVAVALPDGRFLDIRGVLEDEHALCEGTASTERRHVRPSSPQEIVSILDDYERAFAELGGEPYRPDWNDPATYPFAARTEDLARIVFGDVLKRTLEPETFGRRSP